MASWTDGPEYAPSARPSAFVEPVAAPLAEAAAAPQQPDVVPDGEPSFVPPQEPAPDLRELVPSAAPGRNPTVAFTSTSTPLTAIQPQAERRPDEPFQAPGPPLNGYLPTQPVVQSDAQVNPAPFAAPGTPQWFAPPPGQPIVPAPAPINIAEIWRATTNWVMIPLLVAMFVPVVSPVAFLVAWICTVQIRYRRVAVRRAWLIAVTVIVAMAVITTLADPTLPLLDQLGLGSTIAAWVLAFVTPGIVGAALRNHEQPDRY